MKAYSVSDTRETHTITQAGTPKTVFTVWLVTERGATGSIEVSPDDWETEKLKVILEAKAAELDLAFIVARS